MLVILIKAISSSPEKVSNEDKLNDEAHTRGLLVKMSQKVFLMLTILEN